MTRLVESSIRLGFELRGIECMCMCIYIKFIRMYARCWTLPRFEEGKNANLDVFGIRAPGVESVEEPERDAERRRGLWGPQVDDDGRGEPFELPGQIVRRSGRG